MVLLVYHSSVRLGVASLILLAAAAFGAGAAGQQAPDWETTQTAASEPQYDDTFAGSIVQLTSTAVTVSRSILGQPPEKRTFAIKSDTRVEGKLRVNAKVTVGFVTADNVDVARLIVVRTNAPKSSQNKK